jgi:hypothetical protein
VVCGGVGEVTGCVEEVMRDGRRRDMRLFVWLQCECESSVDQRLCKYVLFKLAISLETGRHYTR